MQNLAEAHNMIIEAQAFQTKRMNERHIEDPNIKEESLIFLSTKNLNLSKGRVSNLCPKFVGPWKVEKAWPETSMYQVKLPTVLQDRRINPVFHVSLLRLYNASNNVLFPNRVHSEPYDFGVPEDHEWFVDKLLGHQWNGRDLEFEVRWGLDDTTWEPLENCRDLEALNRYLE